MMPEWSDLDPWLSLVISAIILYWAKGKMEKRRKRIKNEGKMRLRLAQKTTLAQNWTSKDGGNTRYE